MDGGYREDGGDGDGGERGVELGDDVEVGGEAEADSGEAVPKNVDKFKTINAQPAGGNKQLEPQEAAEIIRAARASGKYLKYQQKTPKIDANRSAVFCYGF